MNKIRQMKLRHYVGALLLVSLGLLSTFLGLLGYRVKSGTPFSKEPSMQVLWRGQGDVISMALSPDGNWLLVAASNGTVGATWLIDVTTGIATERLEGVVYQPAWAPRGQMVAFNGLWIARVDGPAPEVVEEGGYGASWSPDGRAIAYLKDEIGEQTVLKMTNIETRQSRVVARASHIWRTPVWCPSGDKLLYGVGDTEPLRWYMVAIGEETPSVDLLDEETFTATCSPDSSRVALWRMDGIWTAALDGSTRKRILPWGEYPQWSTDGQRLLFSKRPENRRWMTELWVMKADGSSARRIAPKEGFAGHLYSWSSDHKRLAFLSETQGKYAILLLIWSD